MTKNDMLYFLGLLNMAQGVAYQDYVVLAGGCLISSYAFWRAK